MPPTTLMPMAFWLAALAPVAMAIPDLSGVIRGFGPYKGQETTLLTGRDGYWVILPPDGEVVAVSNRNVPLRAPENDLQEIIRPLE